MHKSCSLTEYCIINKHKRNVNVAHHKNMHTIVYIFINMRYRSLFYKLDYSLNFISFLHFCISLYFICFTSYIEFNIHLIIQKKTKRQFIKTVAFMWLYFVKVLPSQTALALFFLYIRQGNSSCRWRYSSHKLLHVRTMYTVSVFPLRTYPCLSVLFPDLLKLSG